jgi:hypothetical protein
MGEEYTIFICQFLNLLDIIKKYHGYKNEYFHAVFTGLFKLKLCCHEVNAYKGMWDVECSRHLRNNTNVLCCYYMDTCQQLLAL